MPTFSFFLSDVSIIICSFTLLARSTVAPLDPLLSNNHNGHMAPVVVGKPEIRAIGRNRLFRQGQAATLEERSDVPKPNSDDRPACGGEYSARHHYDW